MDAEGAVDDGIRGGRRRRVVLAPRRWCQAGGSNSTGDGGQKARRTEESAQ